MPGVTVYGNDPIPVYDAVKEAAARARRGEGPTLLECLTYRRGGHKRDDPGTYRDQEEVEVWMKTDPVPAFRERLVEGDYLTEQALDALEKSVFEDLEDATNFALSSADPPLDSALEDVYA